MARIVSPSISFTNNCQFKLNDDYEHLVVSRRQLQEQLQQLQCHWNLTWYVSYNHTAILIITAVHFLFEHCKIGMYSPRWDWFSAQLQHNKVMLKPPNLWMNLAGLNIGLGRHSTMFLTLQLEKMALETSRCIAYAYGYITVIHPLYCSADRQLHHFIANNNLT